MKGVIIQISNLKYASHIFNFDLKSDFFNHYNWQKIHPQVKCKNVSIKITLLREVYMIKIDYKLIFSCQMICDCTCTPFDDRLEVKDYLIIKYDKTGHFSDLDDNTDSNLIDERIMMIQNNAHFIDLSKYFFETMVLMIPMKKINVNEKNNIMELNERSDFFYSTQTKKEKTEIASRMKSPFSSLNQLIKK